MVSTSKRQKVLTKEEEEAKSQAYINKLLAQEQEEEDIYSLNYYEGYGNSFNNDYQYDFEDDYEDDDYDYGGSSRSSSGNKKKNNKKKNNDDDYEYSRSSNKKKTTVKKPTTTTLPKKRQVDEDTIDDVSDESKNSEIKHRKINNPLGTYTEEEEAKFLEGISLYGRDWKSLTDFIGTRNSKSVRSHAQKHFIKLYREAKPLPDKVRESGEGYTLSGKPLDPYSASAKPYLANVDIEEIEKKLAQFNGNGYKLNDKEKSESSTTTTNDNTESKIEKSEQNKGNDSKDNKSVNIKIKLNTEEGGKDNKEKQVKATENNKPQSEPTTITPTKKENINKKEHSNKKDNSHTNSNHNHSNNKKGSSNKRSNPKPKNTFMEDIEVDEDGRTLYSKQRPKRSTATKNLNYKDFMDTSNPLTMVKCESYYGIPGSGTPGSQPFSIIVNPVALATMDLHSHLVKTEVIGLLAGEWNLEEKKLYVLSAYPCRSIENDDENISESVNRHVNVEMDPLGEFEIRNEINKLNMKVVGWYHSHPKFAPDPSFVDIENQLNYQTLFREKNNIDEPFVGVIIGPYDPRLPRSYSAVNWFYVANQQEEFGHPKHLITQTEWINKDKNNIPLKEYEKMKTLINNYKDHMERHVFTETWKQNLDETKLEKVIKSLSYQLQLLNTGSSSNNNTSVPEESEDNNNDNDNDEIIENNKDNKEDDHHNNPKTAISKEVDMKEEKEEEEEENKKKDKKDNSIVDKSIPKDDSTKDDNKKISNTITIKLTTTTTTGSSNSNSSRSQNNVLDCFDDDDSELSDISSISSDISDLSDHKMDYSGGEEEKEEVKEEEEKKEKEKKVEKSSRHDEDGPSSSKNKEEEKKKKEGKETEKEKEKEKATENNEEDKKEEDKMDIEPAQPSSQDSSSSKKMDITPASPLSSDHFYDGVNLLKMVEEEIKKWKYDNVTIR